MTGISGEKRCNTGILGYTIIAFLLNVMLFLSYGVAEEQVLAEGPIATYQKNRQAFLNEQERTSQSFRNKVDALKQEIEVLKQDNIVKQGKLDQLNKKIQENRQATQTSSQIQHYASMILFPFFSLGSMALSVIGERMLSSILLFFLALTVFDVFLYIMFKQRKIFLKNKKTVIAAAVVFICCIAAPIFASEQEKRDQVIGKLENAEKMLSKSDYERFIAILEEKPMQKIKIPPLQSGNPLFKVYPEVVVDTVEFWCTLAALYTHENQNGKALDAVKKITHGGGRLPHTKDFQAIVTDSIKYLLQEQQTQEVITSVEAMNGMSLDVQTLLEIASLIKQNGMKGSADKVLGYAIAEADTVADLVHLAKFFYQQKEIDKSNEALEKALPRIKNIADVLMLGEVVLSVGKDPLIGKLAAVADSTTADYKEKMKVVDLFFEHDRKEEAVNLIGKLIRGDTAKTDRNIKKLLYLIDATLERNLLPQTTEATEMLIVMLGLNQAIFTPIHTEKRLKSVDGVPDDSRIMLPQFYGLVNEERGFNDKAEDAYIRSVLESLTAILVSYGYNLPDSLNDFYLLGRVWVKGNRAELIGELDKVYTILEKKSIAQQVSKNDEVMDSLNREIEELKKTSLGLQGEITAAGKTVSKTMAKLVVQNLSTLATVLFILASLAGCVMLAHRYCRLLSYGKTFGFFFKFGETFGWLQVLSVFGAVSGLISVICSQLFLLFQMIQENTYRVGQPWLSIPPSPAADERNMEAVEKN